MKTRKGLKLTLMILICVLIILVGFVGIYTKKLGKYTNQIPNYKFASDIKGATVLELEVNNSTNTVYYDSEGKKVKASEVTEENKKDYTAKEEKINLEENLTKENYEKTVDILKSRLSFLQADQYTIDLDEKTGKIVLTFEDEYPDDIKSILPMEGKLELIDSNTTDVILNYSDVKSVEATYATTEDGYTVYMALKLKDSGVEKINGLEEYKNSTDDNGEVTTNKFKIEFDGEDISEVSYDDMVLTGKSLRIAIAKDITSNSEVNSELNTATVVSKLATMGKIPVVYKITAEEYVKPAINMNIFYGIIILMATVIVATFIYMIVKFKLNGLLGTIATAANVALFTILIRLTDITISLNSISAMLCLIIVNTYVLVNVLKALKNTEKTFADNLKEAALKSIDALIISLIIFIVFSFSKMTVISSMGLLLFWGWLIIILGNLLLTVPMLAINNKQ